MAEKNRSMLSGLVNSFRDMSLKEKIGALALIAVMAWLAIYLIVSLLPGTSPEVDPEPVDVPAYTAQPSPSAPMETPSPGVPEVDRPVVGGQEVPEVGANKLSTSEAREALSAAEKGTHEFINWGIKETVADRQKRIDPHFVKGSITARQDPFLNGEATSLMDEESQRALYAMNGKVVSAHVAGGDSERFRVNIGTVIRSQQIDPASSEEASAVEEDSTTYTVDMRKQGDSWKIIDIYNE